MVRSTTNTKPTAKLANTTTKKPTVSSPKTSLAQKPKLKTSSASKKIVGKQNRGPFVSSQSSYGLAMPKGKRVDGNLKKSSPWYTSITDPLHGADVKIPDEVGVETGTIQIVEKIVFTHTTSPTRLHTGFRIMSPFINSAPSGSDSANGYNYQFVAIDNGVDGIQWGNGLGPAGAAMPFTGVSELKGIAGSHRVVSAGLYIQSEAATAFQTGEMILYCDPYELTAGLEVSEYANLYKASIIPLNQNRTGKVHWFPIVKEINGVSPGSATDDDDYNFKSFCNLTAFDVMPWEMGVIINGAPEGTVFRVTVVVNYEFIPLYNVLNLLDASPSPKDIMESELVLRWVQDDPPTGVISDALIDKPASASRVQHDDDETGFGMMFNVIKELAPLALALI